MATIKADISPQARRLIRKLRSTGLFGLTDADIAGRLIDEGLIRILEKEVFLTRGDLKAAKKSRGKRRSSHSAVKLPRAP